MAVNGSSSSRQQILIAAFIGSDNLGDDVIFEVISDELRSRVDATLAVTSVNPERTERQGFKSYNAKSISSLNRAYRQSDVIVMGGGGIIQDQSSFLNLLYYWFQLLLARFYKKPVMFAFVGVGPLSWVSRQLLKVTIKTIKLAVVRDSTSAQILEKIGVKNVHIAYDPAINYHYPAEPGRDNYTLVSVRRWYFALPLLPSRVARKLNQFSIFNRRYRKFVGELASNIEFYLEQTKCNVKLVSLYDGEDDLVAREIIELLPDEQQGRVELMTGQNVESYLELATSAKLLIGMRLHSLILASVVGTPFVAISYSRKVTEFAKQMQLEEYAIKVGDIGRTRLADKALMLESQTVETKAAIAIERRRHIARNNEAFSQLAEHLKRHLDSSG